MPILCTVRFKIGAWSVRPFLRWTGFRSLFGIGFLLFPARVCRWRGRPYPREFRAGLTLGPFVLFVGGEREPAMGWQRQGLRMRDDGSLEWLWDGKVVAVSRSRKPGGREMETLT